MEKKKKFVFWKKADDKGMYLIEEPSKIKKRAYFIRSGFTWVVEGVEESPSRFQQRIVSSFSNEQLRFCSCEELEEYMHIAGYENARLYPLESLPVFNGKMVFDQQTLTASLLTEEYFGAVEVYTYGDDRQLIHHSVEPSNVEVVTSSISVVLSSSTDCEFEAFLEPTKELFAIYEVDGRHSDDFLVINHTEDDRLKTGRIISEKELGEYNLSDTDRELLLESRRIELPF